MKIIKSMKNAKNIFNWINFIWRNPKDNNCVKVFAANHNIRINCGQIAAKYFMISRKEKWYWEKKRVIAKVVNNELVSQNVEELISFYATLWKSYQWSF